MVAHPDVNVNAAGAVCPCARCAKLPDELQASRSGVPKSTERHQAGHAAGVREGLVRRRRLAEPRAAALRPHSLPPPESAQCVSISIHAPRTGSDVARAETPQGVADFNPRSPHGERPRREAIQLCRDEFQSTLPARGATLFRALRRAHIVISIHAPRTGSDLHSTRTPPRGDISIHAPRTGSDCAK